MLIPVFRIIGESSTLSNPFRREIIALFYIASVIIFSVFSELLWKYVSTCTIQFKLVPASTD